MGGQTSWGGIIYFAAEGTYAIPVSCRTQMLSASWELHKFFHDCKDVLSRIIEKQHSISDELGRDAGSVSALQRKHQNFVQDLVMLHTQVGGRKSKKMKNPKKIKYI